MQHIEYIGENLGISQVGHSLMLAAFVFVCFSSLSYFAFTKKGEDKGWLQLGRWFFRIHSLMVLSLVGLLFYMLLNHTYEYHYIFKHSNNEMPLRYILSCFWAGQEGSFLLWIICQVILGNVLQKTAKSWEPYVMTIYCLVQAFLVSMLLGIHIPQGIGAGVFLGGVLLLAVVLFYEKLYPSERIPYLLGAIVVGVLVALMDLPAFDIGSNPFVLLTRDAEKLYENELFTNPTYVKVIQGQGLNPLLQNYWMTIHPPTLFVGFASTLIPFCYAIAGLWTKKLNEWMNPVLPWIFFGIMILGTGILMGGAWAYESLTFGGFWAWDPVENASLFPWLTFVGAAHVMMVQKRKGQSSYITFVLTLFSFLFVVFSTYLTRSGVLSETSVHSFASGASGQILLFMLFFYWLSGMILLQNRITRIVFSALAIVLFWINLTYGNISWLNIVYVVLLLVLFVLDYLKFFNKGENQEDNFTSREFWMFMGAIFLLLSCFQLIFKTSLPVWNSIFGLNKVLQKTEILTDYSIPQMIIGTFVCLIMSVSLFLKYKQTPVPYITKRKLYIIGTAIVLVGLVLVVYPFHYGPNTLTKFLYPVFFVASLSTVLGSLAYFIFVLKGKFKNAGSSIAHFGFGLILLGAFFSSSQSEVISKNTSSADLEAESGGELSNDENLKIEIGDTLPLGDYLVSYRGKHQEGVNVYFDVDYFKNVNGKKEHQFTLTPFIQTNATFGRVAEPDTRHYLFQDLYTHLTSAITDTAKAKTEFDRFEMLSLHKDSVLNYKGYQLSFQEVKNHKTAENADSMVLHLNIVTPQRKKAEVTFPMVLFKNNLYPIPKAHYNVGLAGEWVKVNPVTESFELYLAFAKEQPKDFIVLKAIQFPMINILWLGCIIMIIGTTLSIIKRIKNKT